MKGFLKISIMILWIVGILFFLPSMYPQSCLAAETALEITGLQVDVEQSGLQLMHVVSLDEDALSDALKGNPTATRIIIPVTGRQGIVKVHLTGKILGLLDGRISFLEIKGNAASMVLPLAELKTAKLAGQTGPDLADKVINFIIDGTGGPPGLEMERIIAAKGYAKVASPIQFKIEVLSSNETVELNSFENYVERTITLSGEVDINQAVGISLNKQGTIVPVPTQFTLKNGKASAVIKHKSNGVYAVIVHQQAFLDTQDHWGSETINTLASKLIISGSSAGNFIPDGKITRAEFAALIVRALGLDAGQARPHFTDVGENDWFSGAVGAAYNAGLISGFSDGYFRPSENVTREQAAVILRRASKAVDRDREFVEGGSEEALAQFADSGTISSWAKSSVAFNARNSMLSGDGNGMLHPKRETTRAEAAVMIYKLLIKAGLYALNNELDLHEDNLGTNQINYQSDARNLIISPAEGLVTNTNPFKVTGITEAGSTVIVNKMRTTADSSGKFSIPINLNIGKNLIEVTGIDGTGTETTQQRTVIYDNIPPLLAVELPAKELEVTDTLLVITGYTESGAAVYVNGTRAQADSEGNFSQAVDLLPYKNKITVEAYDAAGNKSRAEYWVRFKSNRIENFKLPDKIKIGDRNSLQFTLGLDGYVTLKIYDSREKCIQTLLLDSFKPAGNHSVSWDGRDVWEGLVSDGTYRFVIEAKDAEGAPLGRAELTQLAARFPSISNLSVHPPVFNPATGDSAEVRFELSWNVMVTAEVYRGDTLIKAIAENFWEPAGAVTFWWNGRDSQGSLAGDGKYSIRLKAFNPVDKAFASTARGYVTIEKEVPAIKDLTLRADNIVPGRTNLVASCSLSEDALVTARIITVDGKKVTTVLDRVQRNAGLNTFTWNGKTPDGKYLPKGSYKLILSAVDLSGKPSQDAAASFTIESPPSTQAREGLLLVTRQNFSLFAETPVRPVTPRITGLADTADPFDPANDETTTIAYTISDEALVTVTILNGSRPVRTLLPRELQSAGQHSVLWDGRDDQGQLVDDGAFFYKIEAFSPSLESNVGSSLRGSVTVEKGVPLISDVTLGQSSLKFGTNFNIRFTLSESCSMDIKIVDLNGNLVKNLLTDAPRKAGLNTVYWDGENNSGEYGAEGTYKCVINAVDNFGNAAQEQVIAFKAGHLPATKDVTVVPDPFNPYDSKARLLRINYNLTHEALVTAEVMMGNVSVKKLIDAQRLNHGENTLEWNGKNKDNNFVGDGTYQVILTAVSPTVSVFQSVYRAEVTVEKEPPRIALTSGLPDPFKLTSIKQISIRYSLSENARVSIGIFQDENLIRSIVSEMPRRAGTGVAVWDGRDDEGRVVPRDFYTVRIKAVDDFGNSNEIRRNLEVIPGFAVLVTNPAQNATETAVDSKIEVTFTETLNKNVDFNHISLQVQGRDVLYRGSVSGSKITLTPSDKLAYGTTYHVNISVKAVEDRTGRDLPEAFTFSFTTDGASRPEINLVNLSGAATSHVADIENKISTTVEIDEEKALTAVAGVKTLGSVLIPVTVDSNVVKARLTGGLIKELAARKTLIQIRSPKTSLIIPASAFGLDEAAAELDTEVSVLGVNITLTMPDPAQTGYWPYWVEKRKLAALSEPVQLKVEAVINNKSLEITKFSSYASIVFALPKEITANLVGGLELEGSAAPVPIPSRGSYETGLAGAGIRTRNSGTFALVRNSVEFIDIKAHWAREDINLLAARLIVSGVNRNSFAPDRNITRAQFVTMVGQALGLKPRLQALAFTDVPVNAWYNGYVAAGVEAGIISGFADKTFKPALTITREEAAVIILRAMDWIESGASSETGNSSGPDGLTGHLDRFKDKNKISTWARDYVAGAVGNGLLQGYQDETFAPFKKITRAECVVVVRKLLAKTGLI
jgi:flagellar hook assembly protein FlgD